jgi:hypothetical protein
MAFGARKHPASHAGAVTSNLFPINPGSECLLTACFSRVSVVSVVGFAAVVLAQQVAPPNPSSLVQIVRIRTGYSSGSGDSSETVIEPGSIRSVHSSRNRKMFPGGNRKYRITKTEWEDLRHSIDTTALAALAGRTGCPACIDQPETWAMVEFNDGTKKLVDYDPSNPPPVIRALLEKIKAVESKRRPSRHPR